MCVCVCCFQTQAQCFIYVCFQNPHGYGDQPNPLLLVVVYLSLLFNDHMCACFVSDILFLFVGVEEYDPMGFGCVFILFLS